MAYNATQVTVNAFAITKSDTTVISAFGFYVGGTGDVAVMPFGGSTAVTFKAIPVGTIIPLAISKVLETGTSASLIVGFGPN